MKKVNWKKYKKMIMTLHKQGMSSTDILEVIQGTLDVNITKS